ncbi:hypothetical protein [Cryptosporangium aurantiacum]|uniref:NACHT domain-containing protein n=1 Tax=Cryptosporangium aurantiacum TaxID=134849 RepID=A0A1M7R289_9ACTN|nr:hypothetical protein [Cryptosporangium aurantiacum]SHN38837.1 hypothetical protein SAMN05443668_106147 [Cryptosporangium aurantiacum]
MTSAEPAVAGLGVKEILGVVGTLLTFVTTTLGVWMFLRSRRQGGSDDAAKLAAELARAVRTQWTEEERLRRIRAPRPLELRWAAADPRLCDRWANIRRDGGDEHPLVDGCLDDIVERYAALSTGRAVLLGKPGSGKTVMVLRLTLDLIDRWWTTDAEHDDGHPRRVPVLLTLSGWNPEQETLTRWLIRRLSFDYPFLALTSGNNQPSGARRLVEGNWILPVLDGLDELPPAHRVAALRELEGPCPVVLTCRPEAYAETVESTGPLLRAICVQLRDVTVDDLVDYLPRTTGTAADLTSKWTPALEAIRAADPEQEPEQETAAGRVAQVLRTPLMIGLARVAYSDTRADPGDLLDSERFPTTVSIEAHLLEAFLPAAYRRVAGDESPWTAPVVTPWLRFLAVHASSQNGAIAWWRLRAAVPRLLPTLAAAVGLVAALCHGVLIGWATADRHGIGLGLGYGLAFGVAIGTTVGLACWLSLRVVAAGCRPRHLGLRLRWRPAAAVAALAVATIVAGLLLRFEGEVLAAGIVIGVLLTIVSGLGQPVLPTAVTTPRATLIGDRRRGQLVGVVAAALAGVVTAALAAAVGGLLELAGLDEPAGGLPSAAAWSLYLVPAVAAGATVGLACSEWGLLGPTRLWLAARGLAPLKVLTLLEDARRRGVLRQVGGVYEFRHACLVKYLTRPGLPAAAPAPRVWSWTTRPARPGQAGAANGRGTNDDERDHREPGGAAGLRPTG